MSNKFNKSLLIFGVGILALSSLALAQMAQATTPEQDARITSISTAPASTTLGATTTYTFQFTLGTGMPGGGSIFIRIDNSGNCNGDWQNCRISFENASLDSGFSGEFERWDNGFGLRANSVAAGDYTVVISGIRNPYQAGGHYRVYSESQAYGQEPPEGERPYTVSDPFFFSTVAIKGTVTIPGGDPAANVGVNLRTPDNSYMGSTGADQYGFYSFMASENMPTGIYYLEFWPGNQLNNYVSPQPIELNYTGSTIVQNAELLAATKTITGTVKYDNGDAVATGFEVWANQGNGGGGKNAQGESDGTYTLSLAGGSWNIGLNAGWDQELQQQRSVDWTYNQPSTMVDFANDATVETKTVNFTVTKTDAIIKGKFLLPDGTPLAGGYVEARTGGEGQGMGTGINGQDGSFTLNIKAGTYKLNVNVDNSNPDLAKYYLAEISVSVVKDQTLDLGSMTMSEKTSRITGRVVTDTGATVASVWINCWKREGSGWGNAQTDANGAFAIWVSPGQWECNFDTGRNSGTYFSIYQGEPKTYTVGEDQTVEADDIVVQQATATLVVKLRDTDGNGISNMWGWAYARRKGMNYGPEFGSGIDRGTATIPCLGGETYTVGANTPPEQSDLLLDKEVEVTVAEGESKEVYITMVEPDATITGFLKDQDGALIKDVDAEIYANVGNGGIWRNTRLQPDGSFTLRVKGGLDYNIGYWMRQNPNFVQTHPDMAPTTVAVGATVTKILTAFRANTYVDLTLLNPDGDPVPFGFAWCSNGMFMEDKMRGDFEGGKVIDAGADIRDGHARLPLISGDYECGSGGGPEMMKNNWMPPDMQVINVSASSPASITLQYTEADSSITGSATFEDGSTVNWFWCHAFSTDGQFSGGEGYDGTFNVPVNSGTEWFVGCDFHDGAKGGKFYRSPEYLVNVAKAGTYTTDVVLSEELFTIPQGITETFDSTTQKLLTLPDGTTLNIPANALATEGNITLMANPDINLYFTADTKPINFAWNFEALDSNQQLVETFNSNVSICIPYDQAFLDAEGINEQDIVAKYYNDNNGAWQLPDGVTQDVDNDQVCFSVNHFTDFALATSTAATRALAGTGDYDIIVTPLSAGGPQVILANENGRVVANFFAYASNLRFGIQAETADVDGDGEYEIITAPGSGAGPQVRVFNHQGQLEYQFFAYGEGVRTGVNLTTADVDGDGIDDIITSPMAGAGPQVRIFDASGNVKNQFFAYAESYRGGVTVATGDVNGDGGLELVVAPESAAGPQIRVLTPSGTQVSQFFAYASTVRGGYNIKVGDIDGDGQADIVVSPKPGLGPQIAIFKGDGSLIKRYFAYAETFRGGVNASIGDVDGDGDNDVVASPISNAGPQIRVFDGVSGTVLSQFWAYASSLRGNFTSFVADLNGDGTTEIVTGPGQGMGPQVRTFNQDGYPLSQFFSHHTGFRGGIYINKAL